MDKTVLRAFVLTVRRGRGGVEERSLARRIIPLTPSLGRTRNHLKDQVWNGQDNVTVGSKTGVEVKGLGSLVGRMGFVLTEGLCV